MLCLPSSMPVPLTPYSTDLSVLLGVYETQKEGKKRNVLKRVFFFFSVRMCSAWWRRRWWWWCTCPQFSIKSSITMKCPTWSVIHCCSQFFSSFPLFVFFFFFMFFTVPSQCSCQLVGLSLLPSLSLSRFSLALSSFVLFCFLFYILQC